MTSKHKIVFETTRGYITLEPTGKSLSYVVWMHGPVAATKKATIGSTLTNSFERAKEKLAQLSDIATDTRTATPT